MGWLASRLDILDSEHTYVNTVGKGLVFKHCDEWVAKHNAEIAALMALFVERTTENFEEKYLLPGGGKLQRLTMGAPATAVKRYGSYTVGFQLNKYGAVLAGDEDTFGYMSIRELEVQIDNILIQDLNMTRYRILVSLFENDNLAFTDPYRANAPTTVTRLANTDGSLYPPKVGSETEAEDQHYREGAFSVAEMEDANPNFNPVAILVGEIAEHFGGIGTTGRNFVYFHGTDQTPKLKLFTDYVPAEQTKVQLGDDTARMRAGWPAVPGTIHGVSSGAYLSEWAWMPATYGLCILVGVPAPLIMRVHPARTGLGQGLILVSTDEHHPVTQMHYKHDYGFGCGNRLGAAIIEISDEQGAEAYAPPAAYAESAGA